MKTVLTAALLSLGLIAGAAQAADPKAQCETQAAEKKLAGAAKNSFVNKCVKDAGGPGKGAEKANPAAAACKKSADEKKLAGAARNSFLKKCESEGAAAKPAAQS